MGEGRGEERLGIGLTVLSGSAARQRAGLLLWFIVVCSALLLLMLCAVAGV